jgi:MFS family permease
VLATDRLFRLYAAGFFLWGFGNLLINPVIPILQVDVLNISNQWVGYLATTTSAMSMIGFIYWGRMLDRRGPFQLLLRMLGVAAIMPVTYYFAQSVPVLLLAAAAQGLAMAGGELGYVNAAMRFGERDMTASYAAMFAFLQAMRGIPAPFIGAALNNALGPRPVFLIALGLWTISAGILFAGRRLVLAAEDAGG